MTPMMVGEPILPAIDIGGTGSSGSCQVVGGGDLMSVVRAVHGPLVGGRGLGSHVAHPVPPVGPCSIHVGVVIVVAIL